MKIPKSQLIQIIKEEYSYSLIFEAQSPQGVASAIANYLRMKHPDIKSMMKNQALELVNSAVFDMMKIKNLGGVDTQKTLIILTVRDLMASGDLKLDPKTAGTVVGRSPQQPQAQPQKAPTQPQQGGTLGKLSLKKVFMPRPRP